MADDRWPMAEMPYAEVIRIHRTLRSSVIGHRLSNFKKQELALFVFGKVVIHYKDQ